MLRFVAMDASEISSLENYCTTISNDVRGLFPNLNLYFIISNPEKKSNVVSTILEKLSGHPALNEAFSILKAYDNRKGGSDFLGLAEGQERMILSFKKRPITLGFIAIDTSLYEDLNKATRAVHFYMSLFLDTYSFHLKKPLVVNGNIFRQKLTPALMCQQNLKADIYSILQLLREGQYDAPQLLAKQRCFESLTPQSSINPEDYAFPIALDVVLYTIEKQIYSTVSSRGLSQILTQYQLAEQITACFELDNFNSWIQFANCSQTMACSGFSPSDILGAAVNTSTNPFIKAIGHMLAELTNLSPTEDTHLSIGYNPFLADEINQIQHERSSEDTFEMVLIHVMEAESHLPLLRVANNQNEALIKGKILGWCASSLHAAAKAYMGAKDRGIPPLQAARLEFQSAYLQSNWSILKELKAHIVTMYRQGRFVTMNEIQKWAEEQQDATFLSDSLHITISDPKYTRELSTFKAQAMAPILELASSPVISQQETISVTPAPQQRKLISEDGVFEFDE